MIMRDHTEYLSCLSTQILIHADSPHFWTQLSTYADEVSLLADLSLDSVRDDLAALYCPHGNGKPRDPSAMLRSWLLMTLCREGSPTVWATRLTREPVLAILAGFTPGDTPCATTHRDFLTRLLDGPYAVRRQQEVPLSQQLAGRHRRRLADTTAARRAALDAEGRRLSDALADQLLADGAVPRPPHELQTRLEQFLLELGLRPTVTAGLLPTNGLTVAGDGTVEPSAASKQGTRACDCPPGSRCGCARDYLSRTAQFCYDKQHGYRFGDRSYTLSVNANGHDLPLMTIMGTGNESDFTLSLKALDRLLALLEDLDESLRITIFIGDGHHNAMGIYRYLKAKGIIPIIPLGDEADATPKTSEGPGTRSTEQADPATEDAPESSPPPATGHLGKPRPVVERYPTITFEPDGTPLCPGGCRMRRHQYDARSAAYYFICPAKRKRWKGGFQFHPADCPYQKECQPERTLGYTLYLKADADLRLFPPIPRNTARFKALYAQRSGTERQNATADSYHTDRRHRNAMLTLIRLTFVNICKHARIRQKEGGNTTPQARLHATLSQLGVSSILPN